MSAYTARRGIFNYLIGRAICHVPRPVDEAEGLLNAYRAEVLRDMAVEIKTLGDERGWSIWAAHYMHPDVEFVDTGSSEEEATASAATATPQFFQPGRTYTEPGDTTDWRFRCDAITTHPADGERTALGWRHFLGEWSEYAYGEDDFEIHQIADAIANQGDSK